MILAFFCVKSEWQLAVGLFHTCKSSAVAGGVLTVFISCSEVNIDN